MSELLSDLVKQRRTEAIEYADYLEKIAQLVRDAKAGHGGGYPSGIDTPGRKALFDNLDGDEALVLAVDGAVRATAPDGWRGNRMKERQVRNCVAEVVQGPDEVERLMEILRTQAEY
jgi:type I restriction enzyme R subunit